MSEYKFFKDVVKKAKDKQQKTVDPSYTTPQDQSEEARKARALSRAKKAGK